MHQLLMTCWKNHAECFTWELLGKNEPAQKVSLCCLEIYESNILFLFRSIFWFKCSFDFRYGEGIALVSGSNMKIMKPNVNYECSLFIKCFAVTKQRWLWGDHFRNISHVVLSSFICLQRFGNKMKLFRDKLLNWRGHSEKLHWCKVII